MDDDIQLVSDGQGVALFGDPGAIDRFLTSAALPSKVLDVQRIAARLGAGAGALEAGAQIAETSGRWVKLTETSAKAMKSMPLMKGSVPGASRAIAMDGGRTSHILEIVRTPGTFLGNPAVLSGVGGIMAQLAMQQAMDEITDYLARIDEKVDDILRAQKDSALSAMIGAELVIDDAMTVREHVGGVSDVTWSKVQATPATIAETQAYAVRQLEALAEKLERAQAVGDVAKAAADAEVAVREWLAVLARCFQLQDAVAVLELDRVLDATPDELERHRAGIRVARHNRLQVIARSTERLLARMDAAAGTANSKVLMHPIAAQSIKASTSHVTTTVLDFHERLGIEGDREAVEVRRWIEAATDVRDRALESGSAGVESAKQLSGQTYFRARTARTKLAENLAERAARRRADATDDGGDGQARPTA